MAHREVRVTCIFPQGIHRFINKFFTGLFIKRRLIIAYFLLERVLRNVSFLRLHCYWLALLNKCSFTVNIRQEQAGGI